MAQDNRDKETRKDRRREKKTPTKEDKYKVKNRGGRQDMHQETKWKGKKTRRDGGGED